LSSSSATSFGLNVSALTPAPREPPDAWATVRNPDGTARHLDIEMAEYYVDDPGNGTGGSPSRRASGCWGKLQPEVVKRLAALRVPVQIDVRFRDPHTLGNRLVRSLADELVRYAQEFCPARDLARIRHDRFSADSYPLLHASVEWIDLTRFDDLFGIFPQCSNLAAACVGVVPTLLTSRVESKGSRPFSWRAGAEKWLLIYASGVTATSRAGPPPPDPAIWDDEKLAAACRGSVFDRIFFWDRVRNWSQALK
jgi:hypothetical protein